MRMVQGAESEVCGAGIVGSQKAHERVTQEKEQGTGILHEREGYKNRAVAGKGQAL